MFYPIRLSLLATPFLLACTTFWQFQVCLALDTGTTGPSHRDIARRLQDSQGNSSNQSLVHARDGGNRFTWYEAGLGACGGMNSGSDFVSRRCYLNFQTLPIFCPFFQIVALNAPVRTPSLIADVRIFLTLFF